MTTFYQINPCLDYPFGGIGAFLHGLDWVIEMKDDRTGWIVTNNAAHSVEVEQLETALELIERNDLSTSDYMLTKYDLSKLNERLQDRVRELLEENQQLKTLVAHAGKAFSGMD